MYCPQYILDKLQTVQHCAARLVPKARTRDHAPPLLQSLHWLPVRSRIHYKLSTLCHNLFSNSSAAYISQFLTVHTPSRHLASLFYIQTQEFSKYTVPYTVTKCFGQRPFSFAGPTQWNSLPCEFRHIQSTPAFKTALKTYLFKVSFN